MMDLVVCPLLTTPAVVLDVEQRSGIPEMVESRTVPNLELEMTNTLSGVLFTIFCALYIYIAMVSLSLYTHSAVSTHFIHSISSISSLLDAMPSLSCPNFEGDDSQWPFCPSFAAAITFSALFGVVTLAHIIQAIIYRKTFALVLITGVLWQLLGYIFRILSITAPTSKPWFIAQSLLIILAPLWINAFVYMVLGRMVQFFLDDQRVCGIRARNMTAIFVLADVLAFIVQAAGGVKARWDAEPENLRAGRNTYMGGLGLQLAIIFAFVVLGIRFQAKIVHQEAVALGAGEGTDVDATRSGRKARQLLYAVWTVLGLIVQRTVFRLVEFSLEFGKYLADREWAPYVFDAAPMLVAVVVFNLVHPGRILRGPHNEVVEEKMAKKQLKKWRKWEKTFVEGEIKEMKRVARAAYRQRHYG